MKETQMDSEVSGSTGEEGETFSSQQSRTMESLGKRYGCVLAGWNRCDV